MKNFFGAIVLSLITLSACENPHSPASQFLMQFEKTVITGSQEEFEKMLWVDPREDSTKEIPQLISDKDGTKLNLKEAKSFLKTYLSANKIDYTKTTTLVEYGTDFNIGNADDTLSEFKVIIYNLKDSNGKPIASIDLWSQKSTSFAIGNIHVNEKLP